MTREREKRRDDKGEETQTKSPNRGIFYDEVATHDPPFIRLYEYPDAHVHHVPLDGLIAKLFKLLIDIVFAYAALHAASVIAPSTHQKRLVDEPKSDLLVKAQILDTVP